MSRPILHADALPKTGAVDIRHLLPQLTFTAAAQTAQMARSGDWVDVEIRGTLTAVHAFGASLLTMPNGYRASARYGLRGIAATVSPIATGPVITNSSLGHMNIFLAVATGTELLVHCSYRTADPWPA